MDNIQANALRQKVRHLKMMEDLAHQIEMTRIQSEAVNRMVAETQASITELRETGAVKIGTERIFFLNTEAGRASFQKHLEEKWEHPRSKHPEEMLMRMKETGLYEEMLNAGKFYDSADSDAPPKLDPFVEDLLDDMFNVPTPHEAWEYEEDT